MKSLSLAVTEVPALALVSEDSHKGKYEESFGEYSIGMPEVNIMLVALVASKGEWLSAWSRRDR